MNYWDPLAFKTHYNKVPDLDQNYKVYERSQSMFMNVEQRMAVPV